MIAGAKQILRPLTFFGACSVFTNAFIDIDAYESASLHEDKADS